MNISGVIMDSIVDGPGIRMTVFFQGCPHHCIGCQNPETWDYNKKVLNLSISDLLNELKKDPLISGVTFSGGEPLSPCNFKELFEFAKILKSMGKNIWIYTGYTIEEVINKSGFRFGATSYAPVLEDVLNTYFSKSKKLNLIGNMFKKQEGQKEEPPVFVRVATVVEPITPIFNGVTSVPFIFIVNSILNSAEAEERFVAKPIL